MIEYMWFQRPFRLPWMTSGLGAVHKLAKKLRGGALDYNICSMPIALLRDGGGVTLADLLWWRGRS